MPKVTLSLIIAVLAWTTVTPSAHLQKRADDSDLLVSVVSWLAQDVATLKAEMTAVKNTLAKKAMFVSNLRSERPPPNAPIHMHVLDDIGGGYDSTSGVYVAPYSGWYTIHFQLFPREPPHNLFNVDLHHNGATVARARCYEVDYAVTCNSGVTLHANVGDQLWIQSDFHAGRYYTAGFDNLFSAILVSPDE